MPHFTGLSSDSGLTDALNLFPKNSKLLLKLLDRIMCAEGVLSRGEREAIATFVSQQNTTQYCVFYHTIFSQVFSGDIEETNARLQPLLNYAFCLHGKQASEIKRAHDAAKRAGWSEGAIYEVVEVCGIFDFINGIVLAAGLAPPNGPLIPAPTAEGLKGSYVAMAEAINS